MKRFVKILLLILAAAAIGAGVYLNMNKTLNVSAIVMTPETARLTFTEQGVVDYEDQVSIYPPLGGKILEIYVTEGQVISAGDPICTIDDSGTALAVSKAEAQISSLEAQIDSQEAQIGSLKAQIGSLEAQKRNLDSETAKQKDALVTQKNNLAKELDALNAQQSSVRVSKEERLRLQNIILDQNLADIERLTADYNNIKTLYDGGVIPEKDLEASEKALDAAKAQYDQNQQQLQMIANGDAQSNEESFAASRGALQEQLNGIDTSLSKDY
ncbi:MAG: biotin/lipoyl-binding protein, partial [Clostridiales bacterium]|nr:biotin/lipoyl-binding protein [Clostridiales bacterium]